MFEDFSDDARRVMVSAQHEVNNRRHGALTTEHLLLGLFSSMDAPLLALLAETGVTPEALRPCIRPPGQYAATLPGQTPFAEQARLVLKRARAGGVVTAGAVLAAMLSIPGCDAYRLLDDAGVDLSTLSRIMLGTADSPALQTP